MGSQSALEMFSQVTREWFTASFAAPTLAQEQAWQSIARGDNTLVIAPTGSGKTLAAFLWSLDRLAREGTPPEETGGTDGRARRKRRPCRVLYVSPLKALAVDVERNLRAPLAGMKHTARRLGAAEPDISVALRSGDTPAKERQRFNREAADVLITTPESLYLLLTSQARETLRDVETVIIDEVHAVAGTKRGAHLALGLERLDVLLPRPAQRIGLSATVRPVAEVAAWLGGPRPATVVQPPADKKFDLRVVVPVEDMAEAAGSGEQKSIWPHVERHLLEEIENHRSTIVFANSRRLTERLCGRINELAAESERPGASAARTAGQAGAAAAAPSTVARAHHGSVSKEERKEIEEALKSGQLPAVVATSSLELGIDMGTVDLVACVESPPSVASGLQRIGRAGHQVGAVSKGLIFPKYRGDLVPTAVVAERMRSGDIEELRYPRNPLDVLAQHIVAMTSTDTWTLDELAAVIKRAAPYATLPGSVLEATLDMLAGRYPSEEFAELRPRIVWDRVTGTLAARQGAQRVAVTNGGTIPDRGLFGVYLVGERKSRVGELDEEMVYESRVGDVFVLGASAWRIEDITADQVLVTPAPGQPGKLPFWTGDAAGRPAELGRAIGAFLREVASSGNPAERLRVAGLDPFAAGNLSSYLREQREATGHVPDDRTIVVERFRDELGDWRVAIHSPYGSRVHAPWAMAISRRLREQYGTGAAADSQVLQADDGIMLRIADSAEAPPADVAVFDPDDIEQMVTAELGGSALFASRFRECAARALLLPRRYPGKRTPLWQQRLRSSQLLAVAEGYGSFPITLEAMRECLQDVFDMPGLVAMMREIASRKIRVVSVETPTASPFAASLLFRYVGAFMYEGDAPLAERRAQALTLDSALLAELLGQSDLRDLLDPEVVDQVEAERGPRVPKDLEDASDLLRTHGPLEAGTPFMAELETQHRAIRVRIVGEDRWAAVEDAARLRDALGVPLPPGIPQAFLEPTADPLGDLVMRYARTHGPFLSVDVASRLGVGVAVVNDTLTRLGDRVIAGRFRPTASGGGRGEEWCDADVLRLIRRRSLAKLRHEVEPVPPEQLAAFTVRWHGVHTDKDSRRGPAMDALIAAIEQLQGAVVPASALETLVLPARVPGYSHALLDELTAAGDVVWAGHGGLPGSDGWVALYFADTAPLLLPPPDEITFTALHEEVLAALSNGAHFFRALSAQVGAGAGPTGDTALVNALWDLVWAGRITGDTLAPLRANLSGGRPAHRPRTRSRRVVLPSRSGPPAAAGRWWRLPEPDGQPEERARARTEVLLNRHGVFTRDAIAAERLPGGFAGVYPVLRAFEENGHCRRGYFVEGLGGAQFALAGAVDRLRADSPGEGCVVLAATDPAQPYGAALPWPSGDGAARPDHRPGRKAGALVVLSGGRLALYLERGGKTLLTFTEAPGPAIEALASAVRQGMLTTLTIERADGAPVLQTPVAGLLEKAGFHAVPRGYRLRRP
ncbi:ATP-dependent helicase [Streptomyces sp. NPDC057555]|uniref:ATP-dependent helicase n=1 Tax=Streptomyces sp. NPDC057555 TaxID=3346166 RepID=UPI003691F428